MFGASWDIISTSSSEFLHKLSDITGPHDQFHGGRRGLPKRVAGRSLAREQSAEANARHTVTAVIDGTPAQQWAAAWVLIVADGSTFESIGSFHGKVGKTVLLEVHRGGSDRQMSVVPVDLEP
ncbi:hypothetical protein, partial [Bradyrhizobium sp.]|uniref:hypothetical protein n=1 Tax=Bradyrhizobium sp. TaxID=376 RepID=UPI0025BAD900